MDEEGQNEEVDEEDEEDIQGRLTELNDQGIQALLRGDSADPQTSTVNNIDLALEALRQGEQFLERVTAEGKDVDRNLIIVILYNLACAY
jgi:hypothetical protein